MSDYIGFDFDGTIVSRQVVEAASAAWFEHMSEALDDPSVAKLGGEDWYDDTKNVMARAGVKKDFLKEARVSYATIYLEILSHHTNDVVNKDMMKALAQLKKSGKKLALISTTAGSIIEPSLAILGLNGMFDVVLVSVENERMVKKDLLDEFLKKHGELEYYVGDEEQDKQACSALKIEFRKV